MSLGLLVYHMSATSLNGQLVGSNCQHIAINSLSMNTSEKNVTLFHCVFVTIIVLIDVLIFSAAQLQECLTNVLTYA